MALFTSTAPTKYCSSDMNRRSQRIEYFIWNIESAPELGRVTTRFDASMLSNSQMRTMNRCDTIEAANNVEQNREIFRVAKSYPYNIRNDRKKKPDHFILFLTD